MSRPSPAEALALACCPPEVLDVMRSAHSAFHRRHGLATDERDGVTPEERARHAQLLLCEAMTELTVLGADAYALDCHRLAGMVRGLNRRMDVRPVLERIGGGA